MGIKRTQFIRSLEKISRIEIIFCFRGKKRWRWMLELKYGKFKETLKTTQRRRTRKDLNVRKTSKIESTTTFTVGA